MTTFYVHAQAVPIVSTVEESREAREHVGCEEKGKEQGEKRECKRVEEQEVERGATSRHEGTAGPWHRQLLKVLSILRGCHK